MGKRGPKPQPGSKRDVIAVAVPRELKEMIIRRARQKGTSPSVEAFEVLMADFMGPSRLTLDEASEVAIGGCAAGREKAGAP